MLTINNMLLRIGNAGFADWTPPPPPTPFDVVSDSDLMMLYKYNDVSDTSHPPVFTTITNARPYLHLWDSDGNEYSV